jgi:hypothetical protein
MHFLVIPKHKQRTFACLRRAYLETEGTRTQHYEAEMVSGTFSSTKYYDLRTVDEMMMMHR